MRVNGAEIPLGSERTLESFLEREAYVISRVAVEKNGEIVPRARYGTEILSDEDSLEIVAFIGGG